MAKKTKRKVSAVSQGSQVADAVVQSGAVEAPASPSTPRSTYRRAAVVQEFNPDYTYVIKDLKRIGTLAGTFFVVLIALSFIVPLIFK